MVTPDIAGPFRILASSYQIRAANRKSIPAGEQIKPLSVQADSSNTGYSPAVLIDNSGMRDIDNDRLLETGTNSRNMWQSEKGKTTGELVFDLGEGSKLELIKVWNYNEKWQTKRGVKKADISIWTAADGWKKIYDDFALEQAPGDDDYDEPLLVRLDRIQAQKIRFDDMTNFGDTDYIGLGKVQFFKVRTPLASNPIPPDKSSNDCDITLSWSPGLDAVSHNLYFGYNSSDLVLIGSLKGSDNYVAKLSTLERGADCFWRVDEIQKDGSVVKGPVWNFTTGKLVGQWKFDDGQGTVAKDSAGNYNGILKGGVSWTKEGKVGGALNFDGNDGYVDLPEGIGTLGSTYNNRLGISYSESALGKIC